MAVLRQLWRPYLAPSAASGPLIRSQAAGLAYKVPREFANSFLTTSRCRARPSGQVIQYLVSTHAARVAANIVDVLFPAPVQRLRIMLSTASTQTDSMKSKEASSTHVLSLHPPAQRKPDQVSPCNGVVDSWPLVTLHHISKLAPGLSHGAAKPTMERRRQKQATRMSTGGLPPRAALANGVQTGKGKGSMKDLTDGIKRTE
jgi:hypothetical protein